MRVDGASFETLVIECDVRLDHTFGDQRRAGTGTHVPIVPRVTMGPTNAATPVLCLLASVSTTSAYVAAQDWRLVSTSGLGSRASHTMTYDSFRGRTVLHGGSDPFTGARRDTWEWDGNAWSQVSISGPSNRTAHAMTFDIARMVSVLFGGLSGRTYLGDTWAWDGSTWVRLAATGPSPRGNAVIAYDASRDRTVLFGGATNLVHFGDTWEWDGTSWSPVASVGPAPRAGHMMTYDSEQRLTVLFGGADANGRALGDTWTWDGAAWRLVATAGPPSAHGHSMAYDAARRRVLMFGGYNPTLGHMGTTWAWDGTTWSMVTNSGPPGRSIGAMSYDVRRARVVLYGGLLSAGPDGATWEWGSTSGSGTPFGRGCGSPPLTLSQVLSDPPSINTTARAHLSNVPSTTNAVTLGISNVRLGPFLLPLNLSGMPGCQLLQSADGLGPTPLMTGPSSATFSLFIPNSPPLVGEHLFLQAWSVAPGANSMHLVSSNGLDWLIGT